MDNLEYEKLKVKYETLLKEHSKLQNENTELKNAVESLKIKAALSKLTIDTMQASIIIKDKLINEYKTLFKKLLDAVEEEAKRKETKAQENLP